MDLVIGGRPKAAGVFVPTVKEATEFFFNHLITKRQDYDRWDRPTASESVPIIMNELNITVNLIPQLHAQYNNVACACWMDREFNPRTFLIEMDDSLSHKDTLVALGHECVHVAQMALGHWHISQDASVNRWMGQLIDADRVHYYDLPWEVEAHGREYGLYDRFITRNSEVELEPAKMRAEEVFLKLVNAAG